MFEDGLLSGASAVTQTGNTAGFYDMFELPKFFVRGQIATMMTLVEINRARGLKQAFCAAEKGVCTFLFFLIPSPYVQLLYSRLAPLPHPITLYVLRISHSPEAEQAPPLATAARLVALSQVI